MNTDLGETYGDVMFKEIVLSKEDEAKVADLLGLGEDTRPLAVIFDRDGTLAAIHNGPGNDGRGKGKEDWAAYNAALPFDAVVPEVAALLHAIKPEVIRIMVSGRMEGDRKGENFRKLLMWQWIRKHDLPIDFLFMREAGDQRRDSVVKEEILNRDILPFYTPVMAVDDRESICEVWERYGIIVVRVSNPNPVILPPIACQMEVK